MYNTIPKYYVTNVHLPKLDKKILFIYLSFSLCMVYWLNILQWLASYHGANLYNERRLNITEKNV